MASVVDAGNFPGLNVPGFDPSIFNLALLTQVVPA
jgi:hypothetical protein